MLELLTVVFVIGGLGAYAVYNHLGQMPKYRLDRVASELRASLSACRMQAVSRNCSIAASLDTDTKTLQLWHDANTNGTEDSGEVTIHDYGDVPGLTLQSASSGGVFTARGGYESAEVSWIVRCDVAGVDGRYVVVVPGGHVRCTDSL